MSPSTSPVWFDDHCHLVDGPEGDADVAAAHEAGVSAMITVGTDLEVSRAAINVASRHERVWATAGVHPHDAVNGVDGIEDLCAAPQVVAVGECGLDYHYDHSPRATQRTVFAAQVDMAHRLDLALVIHTRSAWDETFDVLDDAGTPARTVFHCFTGGPAEAEKCLERGASLSISGIVTFGSADDVRAAVAATPLDRLLVETDSPYLTPIPFRGRRNEPARVTLVGAAVAEVLDRSVDEVAAATTANAYRLYGLSPDTAGSPDRLTD